MKITKTVSQQVEVEINLPMFRKRNNGDITHYYAFYSDLSSENVAFSIEGERLNHFHNFCYLSDCTMGEEITFAEFYSGLLTAQSYLANQVKKITSIDPSMSEDDMYYYYDQQEQLKREAMEGRSI
jgi:hypothetical protein